MTHVLAEESYTNLIQSGGPVLVAAVVIFVGLYFLGVRVVMPVLALWRQIVSETSVITVTLKDTAAALTAATEKAAGTAERNAEAAARLEVVSERLCACPAPARTH